MTRILRAILLAILIFYPINSTRGQSKMEGGSPTANLSNVTQQYQVARGSYLVNAVANCGGCHTPLGKEGKPITSRFLSGHIAGSPPGANTDFEGPWGISFASNLTPDKETGLGRWTEEQFIKVMREGIEPDGKRVLPPQPWQAFRNMTDSDLEAIWEYLKSIPPVSNKVPENIPPK